ncbi:unnamed protein product [Chondrus crispus]|uniref:F-box domain-containing protein n=1 Tax=Chondrus crispus TaxID=2769 RepID=R7QL31_CHOCR|nr:unnamed protein product [Chondrus crispus]CDF38463.1 unnamed protein product [Chondrus crispus]|eukprot:XP_005718356.1 unnamed protein product [Chondrus crispus]
MTIFFHPKPWLGLFQTDFVSLLEEPKRPSPAALPSDQPEPRSEAGPSTDEPAAPVYTVLSLPSEVLNSIFSRLEPEHLSAAAQVCNKWLSHAYEPRHWRRIARRTWPGDDAASLEHMLYEYKTWRLLATRRPRLRTNAIYVSRHQYAKTSSRAATAEPQAPVFLVTYYRLLRFYTDGTVVALTSPELPHVAYKRVRRWHSSALSSVDRDKPAPSIGTYELDERSLDVRVALPMSQPKFPAMRTGTMYMRFSLAGTVSGAFDRLFLTEHYAIMDHDGGDVVSYGSHELHGKPFRLVPVLGFRDKVYREFPLDDHKDLEQWYEMKRASRAAKRQRAANGAQE